MTRYVTWDEIGTELPTEQQRQYLKRHGSIVPPTKQLASEIIALLRHPYELDVEIKMKMLGLH